VVFVFLDGKSIGIWFVSTEFQSGICFFFQNKNIYDKYNN